MFVPLFPRDKKRGVIDSWHDFTIKSSSNQNLISIESRKHTSEHSVLYFLSLSLLAPSLSRESAFKMKRFYHHVMASFSLVCLFVVVNVVRGNENSCVLCRERLDKLEKAMESVLQVSIFMTFKVCVNFEPVSYTHLTLPTRRTV